MSRETRTMRPGQDLHSQGIRGAPRTAKQHPLPAQEAGVQCLGVAFMHAPPFPCPGLCANHADPEASKVTLTAHVQNGAQCGTALGAVAEG